MNDRGRGQRAHAGPFHIKPIKNTPIPTNEQFVLLSFKGITKGPVHFEVRYDPAIEYGQVWISDHLTNLRIPKGKYKFKTAVDIVRVAITDMGISAIWAVPDSWIPGKPKKAKRHFGTVEL